MGSTLESLLVADSPAWLSFASDQPDMYEQLPYPALNAGLSHGPSLHHSPSSTQWTQDEHTGLLVADAQTSRHRSTSSTIDILLQSEPGTPKVECTPCPSVSSACPSPPQRPANINNPKFKPQTPATPNANDPYSYLCGICEDKATGRHYGAISCDGCKGFFRRTVRKGRKGRYCCRFLDQCTIDKDHRNSCRACRYRKCVDAGMKAESVQNERDRIFVEPSSRRSAPSSFAEPATVSPPASVGSDNQIEDISSQFTQMSAGREETGRRVRSGGLLQLLLEAEQALKDRRSRMNTDREANLNVKSRPVGCDSNIDICMQQLNGMVMAQLDDVTESMRLQLLLMVEWAKAIAPFRKLPMHDQINLLRNYSAQHLLICGAYRSRHLHDCVLLTNDTVVARDAKDVHDINNVSMKILDEMVGPIKKLNIEDKEFVALKGITLFDPSVRDLHNSDVVEQVRQSILDELEAHVVERAIGRSVATRMANLLLVLPSLRAAAQSLVEDINMVTLFGLARLDSLLEELLPINYQSSAAHPQQRPDADKYNQNKRRLTDPLPDKPDTS